MCDLCAKGFFNYEFNSADIDKISNFNEIASNFTYLCTSKFIKYNLTDTDHLLLKSKFYGKGKSGMYFCIFGSCQPLNSSKLSLNSTECILTLTFINLKILQTPGDCVIVPAYLLTRKGLLVTTITVACSY